MSETDRRQRRLMDSLYYYDRDHPGKESWIMDLSGTWQEPVLEDLWRKTLLELDGLGLIKLFEAKSFENIKVMITDAGRADVESRGLRRLDPVQRNSAARDAIVRFLHVAPDHQGRELRSLLDSRFGRFEGDLFTRSDIRQATAYLAQKRMADVDETDEGPWWTPRLTDRGVDCAEQFGGSVAAYLSHNEGKAGNTTVNFHGPVTGSNVAWSSREITQAATTSTGLAGDELAALMAAIRQALPVLGLTEDESARLRGQLEVAEGELESDEPDAGVVKSVLKRVLGRIGDVGTTSLGVLLTAHGTYLMEKAGIPLA
ncbi:hypothetical protein ONO86_04650 [Micromonospora noduli]|nr:hypothetical protein ONO86_04650 [Micromonospora noduli]